MRISTSGIVVSSREIGEACVLTHLFTPSNGLMTGLIKHSRRGKNVTQLSTTPGNLISVNYYAREEGLGTIAPEIIKSYTLNAINERMKLQTILALMEVIYMFIKECKGMFNYENFFLDTVSFLDAFSRDDMLSEEMQRRDAYDSSTNQADNLNHNADAKPQMLSSQSYKISPINLFRFIIICKKILSETGYGFHLDSCIATQESDVDSLTFLSPKSASAVCAIAAEPYKNVMMPLPKFFITDKFTDVKADKMREDLANGIKIIDYFVKKAYMRNHFADNKKFADLMQKMLQMLA